MDVPFRLCLNNDDDNPFEIAQLISHTLMAMLSLCDGVVRSTVQYTLEVSLSIVPSIPQIWISTTDLHRMGALCNNPT